MIQAFLAKIFGSRNDRLVKTMSKAVAKINALEAGIKALSDAEIKAIAESYNPAKHKAPIVIGHPTLDAPAWGWVDQLTAVGGDLFATESKVDPAFAEMRTAGRYEQRSIALYAPADAGNPPKFTLSY